jgi:hypothetical protein
MKKILLFVLIALALFAGWRKFSGESIVPGSTPRLVNKFAKTSPRYAAHQVFVDRVNANPQILALFADARSEEALYSAWNESLRYGARALPGDRLVKVTRTEVAIMARLPEASCAKLLRPRNRFDEALGADIRAAVEDLPPYHHKVMAEFTYDALAARVANAPAVPIDPQDLQYAQQALGSRYPGEYGARLVRVLQNPAAASDADACWAANSLLHTATDLSDRNAEAMLRRILGGGDAG